MMLSSFEQVVRSTVNITPRSRKWNNDVWRPWTVERHDLRSYSQLPVSYECATGSLSALCVLAWQFTRTRLCHVSRSQPWSCHYHLTRMPRASYQTTWVLHKLHELWRCGCHIGWSPFMSVHQQCKKQVVTFIVTNSSGQESYFVISGISLKVEKL